MSAFLNQKEILDQSKQVFAQFGEKWKQNCLFNSKLPQRPAAALQNAGIAKTLVMCAMGESLEQQVEVIKKYRDRFDVITNDKCFGLLLEHGVKADFVMLCDASIPFRHIGAYIHDTKGVGLISTVYGNIEWTELWRGERFFYVNRDSIYSERIFRQMWADAGHGSDIRTIPAGSNVSNAMLAFMLGCDNGASINWGGYDRYLLVGYDFSWRPDGHYYAWSDPRPKRFYMNHRTLIDAFGNIVFTSENLLFSAKWLQSYLEFFQAPVFNCSGRGLLTFKNQPLEKMLERINPDAKKREHVRELFVAAQAAYQSFVGAQQLFEKERGELSWQ